MAVIAGLEAFAFVVVACLLMRAHAQQVAAWTLERRELLNRIQRPEHIPMSVDQGYVFPDPEPDEINDVGTVRYEPEETVN